MASATETHGTFSWNELMTTDAAAARKFYGQLLGWQFKDMDMGGGMTYTLINAGGQDVGGIMAIPPKAKGMPPNWGPYVTVDQVDKVVERAKGLGARVLVEPQDIPNVGRFATISDPQGAMISLITYLKK
jgi:uncharacterized protein